MILSPSVRTTLLICSAACWVLTVHLSTEMLFSQKQPHLSGGAQTSFLFPSFALVDTALAHTAPQAFPPYTGGFEEPFKPIREARRPVTAGGTAKTAITPARPKLMLKGILLKSNPLSILQDETAEHSFWESATPCRDNV